MKHLRWILFPILALVLLAGGVLAPRITGAQTGTNPECREVPASLRARVAPSSCVEAGERLEVYAEGFVPGLLVSTILVDERNTFITNADHAMRVGPNGLLMPGVNPSNFYGVALPSGMYLLFIKDPSGRYEPGRAYFQVVGGAEPIPPTPLPEPAEPDDPGTDPDDPGTDPDDPGTDPDDPGTDPTTTAGPDDGLVPAATGECAANEPEPEEGAQAWMSDDEPRRTEDVTVCARVIEDGQVNLDVTAEAYVYFVDDEVIYDLPAPGADGVLRARIDVSPAEAGDTVDVDIYFDDGSAAFTSFVAQ